MTSDCMDDQQGEAMKPSPSPAAMTEEELAVWLCEHYSAYGGAAWEKRTHAQKRVWRQDAKDICALIAASRGTRALTEEEYDPDSLAVEIAEIRALIPSGATREDEAATLAKGLLRAFRFIPRNDECDHTFVPAGFWTHVKCCKCGRIDRLTGEPSA